MRSSIALPFSLIIIFANLRRTTANDCHCECCTTDNCRPTLVGTHSVWYCSETTTCKHANCFDWHPDQCPPGGVSGQTRAICVTNSERILQTSLVTISIHLIVLLLKDAF